MGSETGMVLVLVIAWVAVKFGINTTSVVLEMGINFTRRVVLEMGINFTRRNGDKFHEAKPSEIYPHFQYNTRGIYPKFHCYPCYY